MTRAAPPSPQGGGWISISVLGDQGRRFMFGALSGTITAAVLQPLDVIKTTQQGRQMAHETAHNVLAPQKRLLGVISTCVQLVKAEGIQSLWKGLNATVVRVFFGAGIYFASLHSLIDAIGTSSTEGGVQSFIAGAGARGLAAAILSPIAVVKTRLEWAAKGKSPYRGTTHALSTIARTEGLASLYSGLLPTIIRDAPFSGLYFALYTRMKRVMLAYEGDSFASAGTAPNAGLDDAGGSRTHNGVPSPPLSPSSTGQLSPAANFFAGLCAGAGATLVTHPADVVKTRLQLRDAGGRFVDGALLLREVRTLWEAEGPRALMTGAGARVAKRGVQTAITWTLFEEAMKRSGGGGV